MRTVIVGQLSLAVVDDEDYAAVASYTWHCHVDPKNGRVYANRDIEEYHQRRTQSMHRHIMNVPVEALIDHRNGDGLDNRRGNLRIATPSQNQANTGRRKHSKSPYKGITQDAKTKKWIARIQANKIGMYLGMFSTPEEAARVYDAAAMQHFGEFAFLNFPFNNSCVLEPAPTRYSPLPAIEKTSIYRGVHWHNKNNVWVSMTRCGGKHRHLGCFDNQEQAARRYDAEIMLCGGKPKWLNFPEEYGFPPK